MTFLEAIRIALQSLWGSKLRSALTLLGVVISVAAVITVVTFVAGIQDYVREKVFNLGADIFVISKVTPSSVSAERSLLPHSDCRAIRMASRKVMRLFDAVNRAAVIRR